MVISRWALFASLCAISAPLLWALVASGLDRAALGSFPPGNLQWDAGNYRALFQQRDFGRLLTNGATVGIASATLIMIMSAPIAFWFSRLHPSDDRAKWLIVLLTTRFAPAAAVAVPLYWAFARLGLLATLSGTIIAHTAVNISVGVWVMRLAFDSVPPMLNEAACLDGDSLAGALWRIVIPSAAPGLFAGFAVLFALSWNESLLATTLGGFQHRTVSAGVLTLVTPQGTFWGQVAAAACLSMLPSLGAIIILLSYWNRSDGA